MARLQVSVVYVIYWQPLSVEVCVVEICRVCLISGFRNLGCVQDKYKKVCALMPTRLLEEGQQLC